MKKDKPPMKFVDGPIKPEDIAKSIANHREKTHVGAHQIFLGQVRADEVDGRHVDAIEYSAHEEMAFKVVREIREAAFDRYDLSCMHISHSIGTVPKGEVCFMVFVSSPHRDMLDEACRYLVDAIKADAPIFGKEVFEDATHQWKTNR